MEEYDPLDSQLLWTIVTVSFAVLLLAFWLPIQDILLHGMMRLGWDVFLQQTTVPYELHFISTLLTLFGFHIQTGNEYITWQQALGKNDYIFFTWNCGGWQSFLLFFVSAIIGLRGKYTLFSKWETLILGIIGTYLFTMFRLMAVLIIYILVGRPLGILFHDYLTIFLTFGYLALFWWFAKRFLLTEKQNYSFHHLVFGRGTVAIVVIIALLSNYLAFFTRVPIAHAAGSPTIEQQINIIDQTPASTTSTTDTPTDNSLGLVNWDGTKYTGATVYFEVIMECVTTCGGGNAQASATLYSSGGSAVSGSTVNTSATSYTRVRSSAITSNLTNNTDYTVRFRRDATNSGSVSLRAARLIIVQTSATMITDTETQIELGDNTTVNGGTDTPLANSKFWKYDTTVRDGTISVFFEATLKDSSSSKTATATLYPSGTTCSGAVTGSAVNVSGTTWTRSRSSSITLTNGTTYMVCIKSSTAGTTASIASAKIIIDQTNSSGLTKMELYHEYNNTLVTSSGTTILGQNYFDNYTAANWAGGTFTYLWEGTIKTSSGSDVVTDEICYKTTSACDTTITNALITTTSTSWALTRASLAFTPVDGKENDTGIKVTLGTDTISAANTWVIIQVSSLSTPEHVLPFLPLALFIPAIITYVDRRRKRKSKGFGL